MTPEDIDNMQAGRELDRLIAEAVIQLPRATPIPFYSTDMGGAWLVLEKMRQSALSVQVEDSRANGWHCRLLRWVDSRLLWEHLADIEADTAPLAICRAALKAITAQAKQALQEQRKAFDTYDILPTQQDQERKQPKATPKQLKDLYFRSLTSRGWDALVNQTIEDIENQEEPGK